MANSGTSCRNWDSNIIVNQPMIKGAKPKCIMTPKPILITRSVHSMWRVVEKSKLKEYLHWRNFILLSHHFFSVCQRKRRLLAENSRLFFKVKGFYSLKRYYEPSILNFSMAFIIEF